MTIVCAACSARVEFPERVGFRDTCPACDAWLHSCVNCAFWSDGQCREPSAEKVKDPEGQNYCEWFKASTQDAERSTQGKGVSGGRGAAEEMWRKLVKQKKE